MILVTGGAGYIGSHVNKLLHKSGYQTATLDNLVYGHAEFEKWGSVYRLDLSKSAIDSRLLYCKAVIHLAAYAYVGESVEDPAKYYNNNLVNTIHLLDGMRGRGVDKIVFSSSCTVYGVPEKNPITEDMTKNPISPYGRTKRMIEQVIEDYATAYGLRYVILRYFNAAGADPDGEIGEWHVPETHLIPLILDAAAGVRSSVKVFGNDYNTPDGTCVRDYIHVSDLADAHLRALRYLENGGDSVSLNLGNNKGYSVLEVIESVKRVTGRDFKVEYVDRRPGDPAELIGSNVRAREVLGWAPKYGDIDVIVRDAWNWYQKLTTMRVA